MNSTRSDKRNGPEEKDTRAIIRDKPLVRWLEVFHVIAWSFSWTIVFTSVARETQPLVPYRDILDRGFVLTVLMVSGVQSGWLLSKKGKIVPPKTRTGKILLTMPLLNLGMFLFAALYMFVYNQRPVHLYGLLPFFDSPPPKEVLLDVHGYLRNRSTAPRKHRRPDREDHNFAIVSRPGRPDERITLEFERGVNLLWDNKERPPRRIRTLVWEGPFGLQWTRRSVTELEPSIYDFEHESATGYLDAFRGKVLVFVELDWCEHGTPRMRSFARAETLRRDYQPRGVVFFQTDGGWSGCEGHFEWNENLAFELPKSAARLWFHRIVRRTLKKEYLEWRNDGSLKVPVVVFDNDGAISHVGSHDFFFSDAIEMALESLLSKAAGTAGSTQKVSK